MKIYTREEAIKMLLDGKQMTSDEFEHPDSTYCVYDTTVKDELPFRCIYKKSNAPMDIVWSTKTWRMRKYTPQDKELVWCWESGVEAASILRYYDAENNTTFTAKEGRRAGVTYENYAPFNGTLPPNICKPEELED